METKKILYNNEIINFIISVSDDEIEVNLPIVINNLDKTIDLSKEFYLLRELEGSDQDE